MGGKELKIDRERSDSPQSAQRGWEWESDSDGGLGTSLFALLCGRDVEVRPGFTEDKRR
jgi:hypothetical protein